MCLHQGPVLHENRGRTTAGNTIDAGARQPLVAKVPGTLNRSPFSGRHEAAVLPERGALMLEFDLGAPAPLELGR